MRGYAVFVLMTALLLTACGFHLRGDVRLAPELSKIHIKGADPYDPLVRELTRSLTTTGAAVVDEDKDATAILYILKNSGSRRVLSVSSAGKVKEYELYQALVFKLNDAAGRELLAPQQLELTRDYLFDKDDVLGTSNEEDVLRRNLRRDLVRLLMLRLEALGR
jgi:LPS-assembly lipoprotein